MVIFHCYVSSPEGKYEVATGRRVYQTRPANMIADVELYQPKIVWNVVGLHPAASLHEPKKRWIRVNQMPQTSTNQWSWMGIAGGNHYIPHFPMEWLPKYAYGVGYSPVTVVNSTQPNFRFPAA